MLESLDDLKFHFQGHKYYNRTITLKPNPNRIFDIDDVVNYFHARGYKIWLVKVDSMSQFTHYHGIFNHDDQITKKMMNTLRRYMNLKFGFFHTDLINDDISLIRWHMYIHMHPKIHKNRLL